MACERLIRWTCDYCGAVVERTGYGFPKGWGHVFLTTDARPIHYCAGCGLIYDLTNGKPIPAAKAPGTDECGACGAVSEGRGPCDECGMAPE